MHIALNIEDFSSIDYEQAVNLSSSWRGFFISKLEAKEESISATSTVYQLVFDEKRIRSIAKKIHDLSKKNIFREKKISIGFFIEDGEEEASFTEQMKLLFHIAKLGDWELVIQIIDQEEIAPLYVSKDGKSLLDLLIDDYIKEEGKIEKEFLYNCIPFLLSNFVPISSYFMEKIEEILQEEFVDYHFEHSPSDDRQTLLFYAAVNDQEDIVSSLLQRGFSIDYKNCLGLTPLNMALFYQRQATAERLLIEGASLSSCSNEGLEVLNWLVYQEKDLHFFFTLLFREYDELVFQVEDRVKESLELDDTISIREKIIKLLRFDYFDHLLKEIEDKNPLIIAYYLNSNDLLEQLKEHMDPDLFFEKVKGLVRFTDKSKEFLGVEGIVSGELVFKDYF